MSAAGGMTQRLLLAGLLVTLAPLASAAPRVLLESTDATVQMEGELRCSRDAQVTVVARDPALLSGNSARLQSLLDATHAMLGFECRNLPGMVVTGYLDGLDTTGYKAVARPANDWRLQTSRTMQVSAAGSGQSQSSWQEPAVMQQSTADFAVRDLHRGMGVQDSLATLRDGFDTEPRYDTQRRLLSVVDGGCPVSGEILRRESSLRAGDACLEAKFSSDREPRLQQLNFGQAVDRNQSASIRGELERRYGRPVQAANPTPNSTRLSWGERLPGTPVRHEMEALIEVQESLTVLVLQLHGAEQAPRYQVNF